MYTSFLPCALTVLTATEPELAEAACANVFRTPVPSSYRVSKWRCTGACAWLERGDHKATPRHIATQYIAAPRVALGHTTRLLTVAGMQETDFWIAFDGMVDVMFIVDLWIQFLFTYTNEFLGGHDLEGERVA